MAIQAGIISLDQMGPIIRQHIPIRYLELSKLQLHSRP